MSDFGCLEPWLGTSETSAYGTLTCATRAQAVTRREPRALARRFLAGIGTTDERFELGPHRLVAITIPDRRAGSTACRGSHLGDEVGQVLRRALTGTGGTRAPRARPLTSRTSASPSSA